LILLAQQHPLITFSTLSQKENGSLHCFPCIKLFPLFKIIHHEIIKVVHIVVLGNDHEGLIG